MNPGDFDALFDTFRRTVFRLEGLAAYNVGGTDAERMAAWRGGAPLPERSVRTSPWLARIATSTVAGQQWERVRVVDNPLTEYQRYELVAYQESQSAGERILITPRGDEDLGPDFWLFDHDTPDARAAIMNYSPAGEWLGVTLVTDPEDLARLAGTRAAVLRAAVPLNSYLATA